MIIDENAGSGGDLLPWMFRKFKVGPDRRQAHVGRARRHPRLPGPDGRRHDHGAEPRDLDPEKGWVVENEGVPPDIEVEQTPADVIAGRDPQLERAIAIVLDELKKNPPKTPSHPPFPVKAVAPAGALTRRRPRCSGILRGRSGSAASWR